MEVTAPRGLAYGRKWVLIHALALSGLVALAACSGTTRRESGESSPNSDPASQAPPTPRAAPERAPGDRDSAAAPQDPADEDVAGRRAVQEPRPAADAVFSVATFNILYSNPDLADIARVIRAANADLVALQETNPASERHFRRVLADLYPHMYFHSPGRYRAGGFGFLSRVPLRDLHTPPRRHGPFGAWLATAELGGRTVRVANVHMASIRISHGAGPAQAMRSVRAMEAVHEREVAALLALLPERGGLVLGDLNSLSTYVAPVALRERGYVDSFAAVVDDDPDTHYTWRRSWGGRDIRLRIDYVFHSADAVTLDSRVIHTDASDHDLVRSELGWRATP